MTEFQFHSCSRWSPVIIVTLHEFWLALEFAETDRSDNPEKITLKISSYIIALKIAIAKNSIKSDLMFVRRSQTSPIHPQKRSYIRKSWSAGSSDMRNMSHRHLHPVADFVRLCRLLHTYGLHEHKRKRHRWLTTAADIGARMVKPEDLWPLPRAPAGRAGHSLCIIA